MKEELYLSIFSVTVKTPQFKDGKIDRYHTQAGIYDSRHGGFIPEKAGNGNHKIHFGSLENLKKFQVA